MATVNELTMAPSFSACSVDVSSHRASPSASAIMRPFNSWIHGLPRP
ncbi:hypothetical protein [Streptomyces sp. NPDC002088]